MSKMGNHALEAEESAPHMSKKRFLEAYGNDAMYIWHRVNGADDSLEDEAERQREINKEQERIRESATYSKHKQFIHKKYNYKGV
jgi:hypothetical protein